MKYLLDTDHLSIMEARQRPALDAIVARMSREVATDIVVSVVSLKEQMSGRFAVLARARTSAEFVVAYRWIQATYEAYRPLTVLPFDAAAATAFDSLAAHKLRVGSQDLRIAAIALSRGLVVVTRNTRDFGQVPGLFVEDWTV